MYAMSETSARRPSDSIAPPPTGSASVSMSSCFAEEELLTRLCQPEIAPHAIATNRIGQRGPRSELNQMGPAGILTGMVVKGGPRAPIKRKMIAADAWEKPKEFVGWINVRGGNTSPA